MTGLLRFYQAPPLRATPIGLARIARRVAAVAGVALLFLGVAPGDAVAQIAVNPSSTGGGTGSTIDVTHTISGTNRYVLVQVVNGNGWPTITSIVWDPTGVNEALSVVNTATQGADVRTALWGLVNPTAKTATMRVTLSGGDAGGTFVAVTSFTGVNQTTALGTPVTAIGGVGTTPTVTVSSATGDLVVDAMGTKETTGNKTPGPGQNEHWDSFNGDADGAGSTEAGAASVVMNWTGGVTEEWATIGVALKPATPAATLLGRYWFNEAPSGQGPTTVADDQTSPINLSVTYDTSMSWGLTSGHRGLGTTTGLHAGIVRGGASGTKYTTNLNGSTAATFEMVAGYSSSGDTQRLAGFQTSSGTRTAMIGTGSNGSLEFRFATTSQATVAIRWGTGYADGVRRTYHIVYDADNATQTSRVRLYADGVDQGAGTLNTGAWPAPGEGLNLSAANQELTMMNKADDLAKGMYGTVFYYAVYNGALSNASISSNATALLADDDNLAPGVTVTPDGLALPVVRQAGTGYSEDFTVTNGFVATEDFDLLARVGPTPSFLSIDSITGTGVSQGGQADSARVTGVPASSARTITVWYTVASSTDGRVDTLYLRARSVTQSATSDEGYVQVEFDAPAPPPPPCSANVMMIVSNSASPTASDQAIAAYLASNGLTVFYADDSDPTSTYNTMISTNNIVAVYISESVGSATLGTKARDLTVGVVTANDGSWADNLLSGSDGATLNTAINILDNTHYITSGFSTGSLTIYGASASVGHGATPGSGATILAQHPTTSGNKTLLVYETGAQMASGTAPARRAGIYTDAEWSFWHDNTKTLVLRTMQWVGELDTGCGTPGTPSLSSAANQSFVVGNPPTAAATITVTDDPSTPTITAGNDIRVRIPAGFNMIWDTTITSVTLGGGAAVNVSPTLSGYEDAKKTVVVNVTGDFAAGDVVTIAGLGFREFTAASAADNLELEVANDGNVAATDDKTVAIAAETFGVSVTPDGLGSPVLRQAGTGYSQNFTVTNTGNGVEDFDLLGSVGPTPSFLTIDSLTGTGVSQGAQADSGRVSALAAGQGRTVSVWYSVATSTGGRVDTLYLRARSVTQPATSDPGHAQVEFDATGGVCTGVTFQQGDGKGSPSDTDDAELRADLPDNNYGAITSLNVDGSAPHAHVTLKFPNLFGAGANQIPLGSTITCATLTVRITGTGQDPTVYQVIQSWVEGEVTWNSRSTGVSWADNGADGLGSRLATAEGNLPAGSSGFQSVDVTGSVQNWSNGQLNEGWVLVDNSSSGVDFVSSEGGTATDRPLLTVSYTPPATTYGVAVTPDTTVTSRLPSNGTNYTVDFAVQNDGSATDDFDLLTAQLPGTAIVVVSITGTGITQGADPDSARLAGLGASASATVTITYSVGDVADGTLDTLVLTARSVGDPATSDAGRLELTVIRPVLTTNKDVNPNGTQTPGTDLTYTLTITNTGSEAGVNVVVVDSLPGEVEFQVNSVVNNLPAGISVTVEYSDDDGATWTYVPVSGGCSAPANYDRCVTRIRWSLLNDLQETPPDNTGDVQFVARIR